MSHIVEIKTEVRDPAALAAACRRLGLAEPQVETVRFFSGTAQGLAVRLPGWCYPVVFDTATGQVRFDNYEGHWGDRRRLDLLLQAYAVEKTRREATRRGYRIRERALADGSIELRIQTGG